MVVGITGDAGNAVVVVVGMVIVPVAAEGDLAPERDIWMYAEVHTEVNRNAMT